MVKSGNKTKRGGGLGGSPSHLMHRVLQLALDIYAEETGPDGLTQRQFAVLEAVSQKSGLTQTDLVRATGIDRSTLADLVSRMTVKGLLDRERSAIDARAKAVSLSAAGQAALDAARPKVEAADKRILALLPKGKRDGFLALLAELAGEADAAPDKARAEAKAAKKAAREAKKAEKLAKKADKPVKARAEKPAKAAKAKKAKVVEPA
ncbi:MAG: MarR family winged helix-turn-helix transcriptional regulator [Brevundimonas sp.]|nr:MarR family winged helix-turn-helix transcriptional regulator [Brevundimonas sp.]